MNKINTLYLIDDDYFFQFLTQKMIESTNMVQVLRIFSNGEEAISYLRQVAENVATLPDVILLDLSMPVMDGWDFLDAFGKLQPRLGKKITIYVVSSSISPSDISRANSISLVTDYLIKPVVRERFIEMLSHL